MSKDENKVILEGRLGADPVVRVPPQGSDEVASASLYTNYSVRHGNEWETKSERHNLVFYGIAATKAREYKKGARLRIEGRLRTRRYKERDTQFDRFITEVVVHSAMFVARCAVASDKPAEPLQRTASG